MEGATVGMESESKLGNFLLWWYLCLLDTLQVCKVPLSPSQRTSSEEGMLSVKDEREESVEGREEREYRDGTRNRRFRRAAEEKGKKTVTIARLDSQHAVIIVVE